MSPFCYSLTDKPLLEFNERNVRNAIANIKNVRDLGERLKIPAHLLDDMEKNLPEHQKLKLVEVWFKVDVSCNWKTLNAAIRAAKMSEWASERKSMSGSFSDEPFSPSNGSVDYNTDPALSGKVSVA